VSALFETVGFAMVTAAIVSLGAVGFTLQYSVSRVFNFAYGAVMTSAAYFAYMANVTLGWNIWLSVAAGAALGAVLTMSLQAGVFGPFLARRADPFTLLIASMGAGLVIKSLVNAIAGFHAQSYNVHVEVAVHVWKFLWTPRQLVIMGLAVTAMLLLHGMLRYTRFGKAMRAVADDADLAGNSGVNARTVTLLAWGISGVLCGLAGVVLALNTVSFDSEVGTSLLLVAVAAAVVGGVGEPYGAMLGALAVGLASEFTAWLISPGLKDVAAFVFLVVVLILRPYGLRSGERLRTEAQAL
jgi:branched-chain amino acid transport system permease protein/neutral amino acid transport system permease protein